MANHINTFLLNHGQKIKNLDEFDSSKFLSIGDELALRNYFQDKRFTDMYINGFIDFVYDNQIIFSWKYWDLIDQLWVYLMNSIREAVLNGEASFSFPDQPLLVKICHLKNKSFLFFIGQNKYYLPYDAILTYLLPEAEFFFNTFLKHLSDESYREIKEDVIPECRRLLL
ncbi:hypothetical protein FAM09_17245 [Niastella caeni]|uniref:Uncharacterized protein n=1 Tax=Niastella caeni TaxID=2569763 RepID=A0A4S8HSZ6_9BACT|nr:hypothetical protein [Niastella caeni]THU38415.1 hypothetical protein FAM09_17245 [Niastella caeni]